MALVVRETCLQPRDETFDQVSVLAKTLLAAGVAREVPSAFFGDVPSCQGFQGRKSRNSRRELKGRKKELYEFFRIRSKLLAYVSRRCSWKMTR